MHLSHPGARFEHFFKSVRKQLLSLQWDFKKTRLYGKLWVYQWLCCDWGVTKSGNCIKMWSSIYYFSFSSWCPWRCVFDLEGDGRSQEYTETSSENLIRIWPVCFSRWYSFYFFQDSYHYINDQHLFVNRFDCTSVWGWFSQKCLYAPIWLYNPCYCYLNLGLLQTFQYKSPFTMA